MTAHEPCMRCLGSGRLAPEETERGTWIRWLCDACLGTGRKMVRVMKEEERE